MTPAISQSETEGNHNCNWIEKEAGREVDGADADGSGHRIIERVVYHRGSRFIPENMTQE